MGTFDEMNEELKKFSQILGSEVDEIEDKMESTNMSSLSVMHLGNLLISVSRPTHKKLFLAKVCSTSSFLFIMD